MRIEVFIKNKWGRNGKNYKKEKPWDTRQRNLSRRLIPYPTASIFVRTRATAVKLTVLVFEMGQRVECEVLALMEQFEDGVDDHNILARLPDEPVEITDEVQSVLTDFVLNVFRHVDGKRISVGRFREAKDAEAHIRDHWEAK